MSDISFTEEGIFNLFLLIELFWIIVVNIFFADLTGRQLTIKDLTQMMLQGMGNHVMKYLKTLPKEEMQRIRQKLIRSLEVIQQKNKRKKEEQASGRCTTT